MTDPDTEPATTHQVELYLSILRDFPALVWRSDTAGACDWFNTMWLEFRGRSIAEEYGDGWVEGVHPDDRDHCLSVWTSHFAERTPFEMEYRLRRHDGEYRWLRDFGRPFWDPEGAFLGYIGACYDITDLLEMTQQLTELASMDALTGMPNRRAFVHEVERSISFANRGRGALVLFADVDGFKTVNDRFGHETGDRVLTEIGKAMTGVIRESDMAARIGGDEFGFLLWEPVEAPLGAVAHRLGDAVSAVGREHGVELGLSIGAARVFPDTTVSQVLAEADRRMYEEKRQAAEATRQAAR